MHCAWHATIRHKSDACHMGPCMQTLALHIIAKSQQPQRMAVTVTHHTNGITVIVRIVLIGQFRQSAILVTGGTCSTSSCRSLSSSTSLPIASDRRSGLILTELRTTAV